MSDDEAPFGTLLGITDGGVEVFSCNYETVDKKLWDDRSWFQQKVDGTYTGAKWQCVELARRYLLINSGAVFDSIPMAYDIFRLASIRRVSDNQLFVMCAYPNGSTELPVKGSLLIWEPQGEFKKTGHVAVIIDVRNESVDIVEQNVDNTVWPENQNYSRRLRASHDSETGAFYIYCTFNDTSLRGWTTPALENPYNYEEYPTCRREQIERREILLPSALAKASWLDEQKDYLNVFVEMHGPELGTSERPTTYYTMTESCENTLRFATEKLHLLFLDGIDYVLHHQKEEGVHFRIPEKLWPKIRKSWYRRKHDVIAGRFDFAITEHGIKVYEYNSDSASCFLECGYIQNRWSDVAGIGKIGHGTGDTLFQQLVDVWKERKVEGPLHLLCDDDTEERYHTLYMKEAAEAAGIECYILIGVGSVRWTNDGDLEDAEGRLILNVWKTWSWRTALSELTDDEIHHYLDKEEDFNESKKSRRPKSGPMLVDILLHLKIRVFEPLWTLITSSKAILPVLWKLKRGHPYLLNSSFTLTPDFVQAGYVTKPVTGRGGANVSMFSAQGGPTEKTEGRWLADETVYQELAVLPKFGDDYVQVSTWTIGGGYGGTVLRADKSSIINMNSCVDPIRVVTDP